MVDNSGKWIDQIWFKLFSDVKLAFFFFRFCDHFSSKLENPFFFYQLKYLKEWKEKSSFLLSIHHHHHHHHRSSIHSFISSFFLQPKSIVFLFFPYSSHFTQKFSLIGSFKSFSLHFVTCRQNNSNKRLFLSLASG